MRATRIGFIREQGFPASDASDGLYAALMFQPRVIGSLVAVGTLSQSAWLFMGLSIVLALSASVPAINAFDAVYNTLVAHPLDLTRVPVAPAPRRFAMGMAAAVALAIGIALSAGAFITARLLEGLFIVAVAAVVFGRRCAAASLYSALQRRLSSRPRIVPDPARR
jgi:hypothetical protein